jgi:hypothetical protein
MTVSDNGSPMMFGGDGFGGSGFIWAFLIFALLMGNGGFFGGNGNTNALSADIQRGFDAQNTVANQREILSATNGVYHDVVATLGDKYTELARDIAGVGVGVQQAIANQCQLNGDLKLQIAETGAGVNANIAQNRFDGAMNTAAINAVTTAQTQKILDALAQNKIEALQGKVNQLELQNAMSGVVRYPLQTTYGAGPSPFCNCGGFNGYPIYG